MAKRPFVEFILQLINIIFTLCGLGILSYGLLCLVKWKQDPSKKLSTDNAKYMVAHRLLFAIESSKSFSDSLPRAWNCIKEPLLFILFFLLEFGLAAFILFKPNWTEVISRDKSGNFHSVYHFMNFHWKVIRWVALAILILQVIAMILALYLRSVIKGAYYDGDDEPIAYLPHVARNPSWKMPRKSPATDDATTAVTSLPTPSAQDQN
ncbi:hypothetical protein L6164_022975 [Bauhinia variegata]|uniref:Uncharacterized protein n=1 Tax=Bauhinia variegata TaxID=167791 RepID=A0ACB9MH41_BAUVA|nr:hypothetical protein L6164_022975 [Bauhinia variegata]